jgi:hypothetical protein
LKPRHASKRLWSESDAFSENAFELPFADADIPRKLSDTRLGGRTQDAGDGFPHP